MEKILTIDHVHQQTTLEATIFYPMDYDRNSRNDVVLISPAWVGKDDYALSMALKFSHFGYVGIALDLYGKGVLGKSTEENSKLMMPFLEDRAFLADRLQSWVKMAREMYPHSRIHAVGFCFGGLCVLDMARANMGVGKVVSFHGLFESTPGYLSLTSKIEASVLVLHGYKDPLVKPEQMLALAQELNTRHADWVLECFGNTYHAFSNPMANDPSLGAFYNPLTAQRAMDHCLRFIS